MYTVTRNSTDGRTSSGTGDLTGERAEEDGVEITARARYVARNHTTRRIADTHVGPEDKKGAGA